MLYVLFIHIETICNMWESTDVVNITYSLVIHLLMCGIYREKIGGGVGSLVQDNGCLLWMLMPRIGDVVIYRGDGIAASLESVVVSGGRVVLLFNGDVGEIFLHLTEKNKVKEKREYSIIHC